MRSIATSAADGALIGALIGGGKGAPDTQERRAGKGRRAFLSTALYAEWPSHRLHWMSQIAR